MKTIVDTSLLISHHAIPVEGELAISAASLAELHFGVLVTKDPGVRAQRLEKLSQVQRSFSALPMDDAVAASYGTLAAHTARVGRKVRRRQLDLVIAATAHAHQSRLATADYDDFSHLTDFIDVIANP